MAQTVNRSKKIKGKGIANLTEAKIIELINEYPYINSFEELCEVRGCLPEAISDEMREYAEKKLRFNLAKRKMELRKQLKDVIATKGNESNIKALITLYQLIASDDELRRLGVGNLGKKELSKKSEITIKSADPDILNKLSDL